jgi:ADP-dependent phosphofructokinase/glucokinase
MNSQLKQKMNGIRNEVTNFNKNIDEFSQICDNELAKLYDNVEKVSKNIGNKMEDGGNQLRK